jgi:outer membrane protein TolC
MKKRRNYFLLAAFFGFFCGTLFAQEGPPPGLPGSSSGPVRKLSPDEAVELAVKNNLGLKSAQIGIDTKKRASDFSWNVFVPTVEIGGTLGHLNEAPQGMSTPLGTFGGGPQWRLAGSLSATLNLKIATLESMKKTSLDY